MPMNKRPNPTFLEWLIRRRLFTCTRCHREKDDLAKQLCGECRRYLIEYRKRPGVRKRKRAKWVGKKQKETARVEQMLLLAGMGR